MKKNISILLTIMFIFTYSAMLLNVSAVETPILSVSSASGHIGDEITVDICIENNPGLGYFQIDLMYDNTKLEPLKGGIIKTAAYSNITSNLDVGANVNLNDINAVTAIWYNDKLENNTDDGVIYSVKFKIIGTKTDGIPLSLNIDDGNIADINFVEQSDLRFYDGVVTVLEEGESSGAISVNKGITAYMVDETVCRATIVNDDEDVTEATLIAAVYDKESNIMKEAKISELTVSNGTITKRLEFSQYDLETQYIKLFLWDKNMNPMCVPGTVY